MANVINLPTYEQALEMLTDLGVINTNVDSVNTNVDVVKTDVATVKTNVATVNTNVNTINTRTNTMFTTLGTMSTTLGAVNTNTARGAVKSVQRGSVNTTSEFSTTITAVNVNKTIVITHDNDGAVGTISKAVLSNSTTLITRGVLNWQVIEFY